jgi:DNA repair exonuclease SbcCD ATPase subunit
MIVFKKVRYKNFQSVGNHFIEIDLNRSHTTLISGENGAGKSSLLESVSYALFGKSLKKVVLAELVNSINKKKLVTEIEFSTNGHEYKIVRGEKPKVLEFYKDNELLNQEAASKDTQTQIEYVLGFDHKTFCQMIVINKVRYIPFMDQSPAIRRKVIEDILDISVISVANDIAKERSKDITRQLSTIEYERAKLLERKNGVLRLIEQQNTLIQQQRKDSEQNLNNLKTQLSKHIANIETIRKEKKELSDSLTIVPDTLKKKKTELTKFQTIFESKSEASTKLKSFFGTNSVCPTCKQDINDSHKQGMIDKCDNDILENGSFISEAQLSIDNINEKLDHYNKVISQVNELERKIDNENRDANYCAKSIMSVEEELKKEVVVTDYDSELKEIEGTIGNLENDYMDHHTNLENLKKVLESLKDTGVKGIIVSEYIDFINQKINEYLRAMEFWCVVTLDENFNETIKLGQREKVSYDSFSTGQQTRLNIAIFLALTEVASIKNSVSTNLIMLDEILENVDAQGVDNLMKLFNNVLSNKNIFIVTQRADEFRDYFRSEVSFKLNENDFTEMK